MTKTQKFTLVSLLSLVIIAFSLYVGGYRLSSEALVKEYLEESGISLSKDPKLVYNQEKIKSYLLESEDYYISLSLERKFFLWHLPNTEINSYSENYGQVHGAIMIRPKLREGLLVDSLFIYYPSMFKFNQQFQDVEFDLVYLSETKDNYAHVFEDGQYTKKSFLHLEDSIHTLKSQMPSYIQNEQSIKSVFSNFSNFRYDEDVEVNVCYMGNCAKEKLPNDVANRYIELYNTIEDTDGRGAIINKLKLEEADLKLEFLDSEHFLNVENSPNGQVTSFYYFRENDIVYVVIPEFYETTYFADNGGAERTVWEDALYAMPVELYDSLPAVNR